MKYVMFLKAFFLSGVLFATVNPDMGIESNPLSLKFGNTNGVSCSSDKNSSFSFQLTPRGRQPTGKYRIDMVFGSGSDKQSIRCDVMNIRTKNANLICYREIEGAPEKPMIFLFQTTKDFDSGELSVMDFEVRNGSVISATIEEMSGNSPFNCNQTK